jgi:soluble lytic murein transglycosylase
MSERRSTAVSERARGSSARRGSTAGRTHRRRGLARRRVALLVALVLGLGAAALVAVIGPLDEAIKEITLPLRHEDIIRQQARDKNLDPSLIAAVIYRESKFRDQTSEAGARGLMQILPATAHFVARNTGGTTFEDSDLADPQVNISYGSWYLRYLLDTYRQNEIAAIAAYNAGRRHVDRWGGSRLTLDDIRFPETKQYVSDVLDKRVEYTKRYRDELGL